ncbi:PREDICTED: pentatricopeptide repeat-containing protein At1g62914, mitochondrial-like isoform X2 [Lupinus angustifolius]|uniref:pentatricopeptide repeat-containing protein At1g62914, mitochondrial-like isoform X2 n=1 Tax=Lupinus angustifolius TaxID=3871 RepID=UPI00092F7EC7|nr:PREDICTED: pentatricopeptide repeat-containing protein At1g62914, mitochondrial-like isoform X2 [Lupinus angustifolius]
MLHSTGSLDSNTKSNLHPHLTKPNLQVSDDHCRRRCRRIILRHLRMSAKFHVTFPLSFLLRNHSFNSLSFITLSHSLHLRFTHSHTSSSSSPSSGSYYLSQFLPFGYSNFKPFSIINPRERRIVVVGLSNIIKNEQNFVLKGFSLRFCPFFLVKIMKLLETREAAFAFFKLALGENYDSGEIVHLCCTAAHVLAAQKLQLYAQDMVSWVIGRVGASRSKELVELMWKNHSEYESDFSVLNTLMRGFLNVGMSSEALNILHRMRVVGVRPSLSAVTILISLLLRIGAYGSVWKLFKDMLCKGPRPSRITFNMMIYWFCRQNGLVIAENLLHLMPKFRCSADVYTYNSLIHAYCNKGQTSVALERLNLMIKSGCEPSISTFNTIMHALCREGNMTEAQKLFDGLQEMGVTPNTMIYNTLMDGYVKAREIGHASMLCEEMRTRGVSPDCVTFNIIVGGQYKYGRKEDWNRKGRLQEAMALLSRMSEKGFPVNKVAYTVLLDGYFKINDLDGAQFLWSEMKERGIYPDVVAFTALIDGLSKAGMVEEAYEVFLEMTALGFIPNNFAYNSLIHGFCNSGMMTEALKLEKEMRLKGLLPDTFTFNILIDGFCRQGKMKSAVDTFLNMHRIGLMPDIFTFNILVGGYCKAFDMVSADQVVNKMYTCGFDPDITTYNTRMHGYCSIRKMNRAVIILDELVSAGIVPDTVTYNTMMSGICNDILDRAMILTAKLLKMGFIPNVTTTNILLSQICKQGMPEKALLWGQKFREISFDFDEISYRILDQAYRLTQTDVELVTVRGTYEKSLFLDFLMYITFDYFSRNKPHQIENENSLELIESQFVAL